LKGKLRPTRKYEISNPGGKGKNTTWRGVKVVGGDSGKGQGDLERWANGSYVRYVMWVVRKGKVVNIQIWSGGKKRAGHCRKKTRLIGFEDDPAATMKEPG